MLRTWRGPGHLLLKTKYGEVDVLGSIEENTSYDDVLADTYEVDLDGAAIRVLTLERLLVVKKKLHRPKDQIMALHIEAAIEEAKTKKG